MATYEMRPIQVDAWRLTWDNWQALTDRVRGRFHQGTSGTFLEAGDVTVYIGEWLVHSDGVYIAYSDREFHETFQLSTRRHGLGEVLVLHPSRDRRLAEVPTIPWKGGE